MSYRVNETARGLVIYRSHFWEKQTTLKFAFCYKMDITGSCVIPNTILTLKSTIIYLQCIQIENVKKEIFMLFKMLNVSSRIFLMN